MFAVKIELLTGRYAATEYNDRNRAEWPPHPARFFSALVAALHDTDTTAPGEREALLWLEQQEPPAIVADNEQGIARRLVHDVFVPVNDITLVAKLEEAESELQKIPPQHKEWKKKDKSTQKLRSAQTQVEQDPSKTDLEIAFGLLPAHRLRQARAFPSVTPQHPDITFIWNVDPPEDVRVSLTNICARITRLGHSSSMVACAPVTDIPAPTLVPTSDGDKILRTCAAGQLVRLEREHDIHQGVDARIIPFVPQRYGRPGILVEQMSQSTFSNEWILFERVGGDRPGAACGPMFASALRRALLEQHGTRDLHPWLSGHNQDGSPTTEAHTAFVGLPFVGTEYADGSIKGLAIIPPRSITDRTDLLKLIAAWEQKCSVQGTSTMELSYAGGPVIQIRRSQNPSQQMRTLRPATWTRASKRFITATPIALDRNPGDLRSNHESRAHKSAIEAQKIIADACVRIGLPRPLEVEISLSPLLRGSPPPQAFAHFSKDKGHPGRLHAHATITFPTLVAGPVILGAGRYYGLGLFLPTGDKS